MEDAIRDSWLKAAQECRQPSLSYDIVDHQISQLLHSSGQRLYHSHEKWTSSFDAAVKLVRDVLPESSFSIGYVAEDDADDDLLPGWGAIISQSGQLTADNEEGTTVHGCKNPALAVCEAFCQSMASYIPREEDKPVQPAPPVPGNPAIQPAPAPAPAAPVQEPTVRNPTQEVAKPVPETAQAAPTPGLAESNVQLSTQQTSQAAPVEVREGEGNKTEPGVNLDTTENQPRQPVLGTSGAPPSENLKEPSGPAVDVEQEHLDQTSVEEHTDEAQLSEADIDAKVKGEVASSSLTE